METSKPRPDLLAGANARHPGRDKRILAHLEHGARPPARVVRPAGWTIDGWTIGLFALLLVMCSMAWLLHDRTITQDTFRPSERRAISTHAASRMAAPPPYTAEAATQAAAIVNVATADPQAVEAETPTAATVAIANAASAAGPVASHAQPARATVRATARAPVPPASISAPAGTDTDVTLLTALVAHAGTPTVVAPERSRDIVDRQDGDSTAQLLARCKQLGLIEGMLCRSRICSGRWDSDAACRAPAR